MPVLSGALACAVLAGCGSHTAQQTAETAPTASSSATGGKLETPAYTVSVTSDELGGQSAFELTATARPVPQLQSYLTPSAPGVGITLPGGAQPAGPLTVSFDFHGKPAPAAPGQLAAVVALSEDAPQPEVLVSRWDPDTQTLSAQTDHLSWFFPVTLDLQQFGAQMTNALNGYLGLSSAKPACVGSALTVGDITYRLDPEAVPAAWPCLSRDGFTISVDLASNSPLGWIVRSTPVSSDQGADLGPDVGQTIDQVAYRTLFAGAVGDGTLLLPGGTTHLRFDRNSPPELVGLRADPGVTLINGLILALQAAFPNAKLLAVPGMVDCLKPLAAGLAGDSDPTGTDIGARLRPLIDCVTSTTGAVSAKPTPLNPLTWAQNILGKSVGAVLSLGPAVAGQLAATLGGFFGELTGANTQTITVRATGPTAAAPPPSGPATLNLSTKGLQAGGGLMVGPNHFKFTERSRDKDGYYVDMSYRWTIDRPKGSDLGYCKAHITVTDSAGGIVFRRDDPDFNACQGGGAWGSSIKIRKAGVYTVTADIEMQRGPALHGSVPFTVDPL